MEGGFPAGVVEENPANVFEDGVVEPGGWPNRPAAGAADLLAPNKLPDWAAAVDIPELGAETAPKRPPLAFVVVAGGIAPKEKPPADGAFPVLTPNEGVDAPEAG